MHACSMCVSMTSVFLGLAGWVDAARVSWAADACDRG